MKQMPREGQCRQRTGKETLNQAGSPQVFHSLKKELSRRNL